MQGAAECEQAWAAVEGFLGADAGYVWRIVLLRDVRQD